MLHLNEDSTVADFQNSLVSHILQKEKCADKFLDIILKNIFRISYSQGYQIVQDTPHVMRIEYSLILIDKRDKRQPSVTVFQFKEQDADLSMALVLKFRKTLQYRRLDFERIPTEISIYNFDQVMTYFRTEVNESYVVQDNVMELRTRSLLMSLNRYSSGSHLEKKLYSKSNTFNSFGNAIFGSETITTPDDIRFCPDHQNIFVSSTMEFHIGHPCFLCVYLQKKSLPFHDVMKETPLYQVSINSKSDIAEIKYFLENIIDSPCKVVFDLANTILFRN